MKPNEKNKSSEEVKTETDDKAGIDLEIINDDENVDNDEIEKKRKREKQKIKIDLDELFFF